MSNCRLALARIARVGWRERFRAWWRQRRRIKRNDGPNACRVCDGPCRASIAFEHVRFYSLERLPDGTFARVRLAIRTR